jgi:hypothetical protein
MLGRSGGIAPPCGDSHRRSTNLDIPFSATFALPSIRFARSHPLAALVMLARSARETLGPSDVEPPSPQSSASRPRKLAFLDNLADWEKPRAALTPTTAHRFRHSGERSLAGGQPCRFAGSSRWGERPDDRRLAENRRGPLCSNEPALAPSSRRATALCSCRGPCYSSTAGRTCWPSCPTSPTSQCLAHKISVLLTLACQQPSRVGLGDRDEAQDDLGGDRAAALVIQLGADRGS